MTAVAESTPRHASAIRRPGLLRRRRPPRVLIIIQNLPLQVDRRVRLECAALLAAGYGVSVICPRAAGRPRFEILDGVRLHTYRAPAPANGLAGYVYEFLYCWLRAALLTAKVLLREGVDVVQACNPPDTYFALALPLKLFGKRFVYDQHDLCPEVYESRFDSANPVLRRMLRLLERGSYATADHVVTTNASYRALAVSRGRRSPNDVTIVRSGPDPEQMQPGPQRPELRQGRRHLLCWLGIMGPQDGVDLLLRSIAVLVHDLHRDDVHVALLGFGDCLDDLRRLAVKLDLADVVTFTGQADPAMIRDYFSTADIGLSADPKNALNDLSTMNKTMEYMAYGLPVVAYDLKETRFSAQDAAVYVEPNDTTAYARAIAALLDQPERRAAMGRIGRLRIVSVLAWRYQAPGYVRVFDRLTGRTGKPAVIDVTGPAQQPIVLPRPVVLDDQVERVEQT